MRAKPGDRIILAGSWWTSRPEPGEVVEARGTDGGPPYVVRWEDGHTSTMFPGPGAVLRVSDGASVAHADVVARPELGTLREWTVRVSIFEKGDDATAAVALLADAPEALTAKGSSRRSTADPGVAHIGDSSPWRGPFGGSPTSSSRPPSGIEQTTGEHDVVVRAR